MVEIRVWECWDLQSDVEVHREIVVAFVAAAAILGVNVEDNHLVHVSVFVLEWCWVENTDCIVIVCSLELVR